MRPLSLGTGWFCLGLLGSLVTPVGAQHVVPADSLTFPPGAQLRVRLPPYSVRGRFERRSGDSLVLRRGAGRTVGFRVAIAERRRAPDVATR